MGQIDTAFDDIEIPDIEITDGWLAKDVETLADCDDAFAYLMGAIAGIEYQIDAEGFKPLAEQRGEWVARAKSALKFKKAALTIVQTRRARINELARVEASNTRERALLQFIKAAVPAHQWVAWVTAFDMPSQDAA